MKMTLQFQCTVSKVVHRNENRYILDCLITSCTDGDRIGQSINVIGNFFSATAGDCYRIIGNIDEHEIYGMECHVTRAEYIYPNKISEIEKFLERHTSGVGKKTIQKITERYGVNTIDKIIESVDCIKDAGVGPVRALKLHNMLLMHKSLERLGKLLKNSKLPHIQIMQIYNKLEDDEVEKLQHLPYILCEKNIEWFPLAESIAYELELEDLHEERIGMAILYYLYRAEKDKGHMFVYMDTLKNQFNSFLSKVSIYKNMDIDLKDVTKQIDKHIQQETLKISKNSSGKVCLYLKENYFAEKLIVKKVSELLNPSDQEVHTLEEIKKYILADKIKLNEEQIKAIYMALNNKLSILTGGPGTGKTYTVNSIVKLVKKLYPHYTIELCAPTGKAAIRMNELTDKNSNAKTIHSLIKLGPDLSKKPQEVKADFLIVDEASMIDVKLFSKLLQACTGNTSILLIGDPNQLPSVGAGLVLKDLLESEQIPKTMLTKVFRQDDMGRITINASRIAEGNTNIEIGADDFYFIRKLDIQQNIIELIKRLINKGYRHEDIQVLSPVKQSKNGVFELNRKLQEVYNPPSKGKNEIIIDDMCLFREGDRVIHTQNNADLNVFNGEIGTIIKIEGNGKVDESAVVTVYYEIGKKEVMYSLELHELELAYALTVHKSQGSEFDTIIMPVDPEKEYALNRSLIYTAITRAKNMVVLIGNQEILSRGIQRKADINRNSNIKDWIVNNIRAV